MRHACMAGAQGLLPLPRSLPQESLRALVNLPSQPFPDTDHVPSCPNQAKDRVGHLISHEVFLEQILPGELLGLREVVDFLPHQ